MANEEHLKVLIQGEEAWNQWRTEHPRTKPDFTRADLTGGDLTGADLTEANLTGANLTGGADLTEANLTEADLSWANLTGANLTGANLREADLTDADLTGADITGADFGNDTGVNLSGAFITSTNPKAKGLIEGVNGFYCKKTESAALMPLIPPGNSMLGSNPSAVIESLRRARRLHGQSMALAGTMLLIPILGLEKIKYLGQELTLEKFGLLAIPISIGLLSLVVFFMSDGLKGARYLRDRDSAMTVGNFPWVLSKFAGEGWSKIQSVFTRAVVSLHPFAYPLAYLYYLRRGEEFAIELKLLPAVLYSVLMVLLLGFSAGIFLISHRFQKPILFDKQTELMRENE